MSTNKIIGVLAVFSTLIITGAFIGWKLLNGTPNTTTDNTNSSLNGIPNNTTTNVSTGQTTSTEPVKEVKIEQEYSALFARLLAQKVVFKSINSIAGAEGSVYALYSADVADVKKSFPNADLSLNIALVDLTNDGEAEALVYATLPGFCGNAGCPLDIYKKEKGKWIKLYTGQGTPIVGVGNTYTNGYADVFFSVAGDLAYESRVVRYSWDGKQYAPGDIVATWDGTKFTQ